MESLFELLRDNNVLWLYANLVEVRWTFAVLAKCGELARLGNHESVGLIARAAVFADRAHTSFDAE